MKKILVFTDSRGQHKPEGSTHKIYGERLRDHVKNVEVDLVLCPMKWTTTLDFFEYIESVYLKKYDWVVLNTGIVEWSPRPSSSAYNDLYNNLQEENLGAYSENSRDYSKKIVNNKKYQFDRLFGQKEIVSYLNSPWDVSYADEPTINMYSLEMAKKVISKLKSISNLIFINSNFILSDWDGDFKKGRPENMDVTHAYSKMFAKELESLYVIDLKVWTDDEIKQFTCDNIHFTAKGSDYIFEKLCKIMSLEEKSIFDIQVDQYQEMMETSIAELIKFKNIERFVGSKKENFLKAVSNGRRLATLIIGFRLDAKSPERLDNLTILLDWLEYHYDNMFDILLVEQDIRPKLPKDYLVNRKPARYEFIFNPHDFNRGWGFNVAVRHFCVNSTVVVPMDTDVLTGDNFVSDVRDCFIGRYDVISPYQNIYYTDEVEAQTVARTMSCGHLSDTTKIKNPVTLCGGIVIFSRSSYMALKGYEQYIGYGCEDRALDVSVMHLLDQSRVKIAPRAYVHLFHPVDKSARKNFDDIYEHLNDNYHCKWTPGINPTDFIHSRCNHNSREAIVNLLIERSESFGDIDLYKNNSDLLPNGVVNAQPKILDAGLVLPPDFNGLDDYKSRELYDAPPPCYNELGQFRNKFLGKRCFIIGNGPSLNNHDLSLLENEYTFGVNSFYYKTRETGFRPYFYVVEDNSVMKENIQEIRDFDAPFKFFPTVYKRLHPKTPNTFFFEMNRGFYEKSSPNYAVPRFSTDATKELYCGQSVTYINLQLAYFMGFTEVYLIGMDFSYIIPKSHKRTGDVLLSDSDDPNHFHKDYFGKGKTWKDPKLERVGNNYRMAKVVYESVGRKIYNATVGGSLEIFDRVDFESVFTSDCISKAPDVDRKTAFAEGNRLFENRQYSDALVRYVGLAVAYEDFHIYKEAALSSYLKAKRNNQPVLREIEVLVKGLL